MYTTFRRLLASTFSCGYAGMKNMFLRLTTLPLTLALMWVLYSKVGDDQHGFFSRNGMILNILGLSYGVGILSTISICKI